MHKLYTHILFYLKETMNLKCVLGNRMFTFLRIKFLL